MKILESIPRLENGEIPKSWLEKNENRVSLISISNYTNNRLITSLSMPSTNHNRNFENQKEGVIRPAILEILKTTWFRKLDKNNPTTKENNFSEFFERLIIFLQKLECKTEEGKVNIQTNQSLLKLIEDLYLKAKEIPNKDFDFMDKQITAAMNILEIRRNPRSNTVSRFIESIRFKTGMKFTELWEAGENWFTSPWGS